MSKRHKVSRKKSKRMFSKGAGRTHARNVRSSPMRGGIRL